MVHVHNILSTIFKLNIINVALHSHHYATPLRVIRNRVIWNTHSGRL